jgi:hypothetical protein
MYKANTLRTGFNLRLTNSQRACLSEIILLLAARARRHGIRGDSVPFLQRSIQAVPGFPAAWAHTLARYVATDPAYYHASELLEPFSGTLGDGMMIGALTLTLWKAAQGQQSNARKEVQAASEAAVQAQMSPILLRGSLLDEAVRWLKSNP